MNKIVIIGGGDHAKVVIAVLKTLPEFLIHGYVSLENRGDILSVPYLGNDDILPSLIESADVHYAAMALGISIPPATKKDIVTMAKSLGYSFPAIVSSKAILSEGITIAEGVFINDAAAIGPEVQLGAFAIINRSCNVDHDTKIGEFTHIAPSAALAGSVIVGNFVQIGIGATVIEYINIASGAIIGAGAVIIRDCIESATYIGVPGQVQK